MVKLEALKNKYFLDYSNVEKYLKQSKPGEKEVGERVRTLSLVSKSDQLDDARQPLSNTNVNNMSATVEYTK